MKRIKTKDIDPKLLITKAEYARMKGISPTAVQKQIDSGRLIIVKLKGIEMIHLEQDTVTNNF